LNHACCLVIASLFVTTLGCSAGRTLSGGAAAPDSSRRAAPVVAAGPRVEQVALALPAPRDFMPALDTAKARAADAARATSDERGRLAKAVRERDPRPAGAGARASDPRPAGAGARASDPRPAGAGARAEPVGAKGAIAFDPHTGQYGIAWGNETEAGAIEQAKATCGSDACMVPPELVFGPGQCAALAAPRRDPSRWIVAHGTDELEVKAAALKSCVDTGETSCVTRAVHCER
jgi:hypothetical protein